MAESWGETDEQGDIFFIFDVDAMQSEYETLEDAVLYCQPKPMTHSDDLYLLFGQLIGMIIFTESFTGAIPNIICLEKMKFAILRQTQYLLLLGCSVGNVPDVHLQNKLKRFFNVFCFYHGSLQRLLQRCALKEDFLLELDLISSSYLAFAQSYGMIINSILDPLPTITYNKASNAVYMKVSQILQACQRRDNVYCGCLFSESRLICSQLPLELVHQLKLLKPNQNNHPASVFYPGFDWPFGVRILQVYVTPTQYEQILLTSPSPYKKVTNKEGSSSHTHHVQLGQRIRKLKSHTDIPKAVYASKESLCSYESIDLSMSFSRSSDVCRVENNQYFNHGYVMNEVLCVDGNNKLKISQNSFDEFDDSCIATHRCRNQQSHISKEEINSSVKQQTDLVNLAPDVSINSYHKSELNTDGRDRSYINPSLIRYIDTSKTDIRDEVKLSEEKDLPKFIMSQKMSDELHCDHPRHEIDENSQKSSSHSFSRERDTERCDGMVKLHLYVQAHSNTILVLLMEAKKQYDKQTFKSLWETILPQLGDIEAHVRSIISVPSHQIGKPKEAFCFITHNKLHNTCNSNVMDVVNIQDRAFIEAMNVMHEQFSNCSTLTDMTFKASQTSVYACQSHSDQVFFQPRGNYKPTQGAPSNFDAAWNFDQRVHSKLEKAIKANSNL